VPVFGVMPDRSSAALGAGVSAGRGNWAVFARYHADVSGNWTSQTVEAGLRVTFWFHLKRPISRRLSSWLGLRRKRFGQ
jgi:hypothetical protein